MTHCRRPSSRTLSRLGRKGPPSKINTQEKWPLIGVPSLKKAMMMMIVGLKRTICMMQRAMCHLMFMHNLHHAWWVTFSLSTHYSKYLVNSWNKMTLTAATLAYT